MMRPISVGFPSGRVKLTLWAGSEDEQEFPVCFPKQGKPFVKAFGIKYELTEEETQYINAMR